MPSTAMSSCTRPKRSRSSTSTTTILLSARNLIHYPQATPSMAQYRYLPDGTPVSDSHEKYGEASDAPPITEKEKQYNIVKANEAGAAASKVTGIPWKDQTMESS